MTPIIIGFLVLLGVLGIRALYYLDGLEIIIRNNSGITVDSFVMIGSGVNEEVGPIRSGKTDHHHIWVDGDGFPLTFSAAMRNMVITGMITRYADNSAGSEKTVIIEPGPTFRIQ